MNSWKFPPKNTNVAKYVECYWFLEKEPGDTGTSYPKLNPDPSAHLILSHADQKYQYEQNGILQKGCGSHWISPHRNAFTIDHTDVFKILGIKFNVGALYSFNALSDLSLDTIVSADINKLIDLMSFSNDHLLSLSVNNPEEVGNTLDDMLESCLINILEDQHSELVRHIIPLLEQTPIAQIGEVLHRSQRTIERSFLKVTHLTLKQYQSMIRLEEILNYLYKNNDEKIDWVGLAVDFDFSDQPHLIRYLKKSIGATPGEYLRNRNLTIDIYGDFKFS